MLVGLYQHCTSKHGGLSTILLCKTAQPLSFNMGAVASVIFKFGHIFWIWLRLGSSRTLTYTFSALLLQMISSRISLCVLPFSFYPLPLCWANTNKKGSSEHAQCLPSQPVALLGAIIGLLMAFSQGLFMSVLSEILSSCMLLLTGT